jgi:hypothetical protein
MMRWLGVRYYLFALFLFSNPLLADPEIAGKREYPANALVRLKVAGVPEKTGYLWKVYPPTIDRADTAKDVLQFAAAPGAYVLGLLRQPDRGIVAHP